MHTLIEWIGRIFRGRYLRLLEAEVTRLRVENRALVNSLIGTAGFPPISLEEEVRRGLGDDAGAAAELDADRAR